MTGVLKSELAGAWYPENPRVLAREIEAFLAGVSPTPADDVIALLLPHAGYRYSGMVAAHGVKLLEGKTFSRVVVMGPSHHAQLPDLVSIPSVASIETPLGQVALDEAFVSKLWEHPQFQSCEGIHCGEHSVQIELPFLQKVLGSFKLVPIVCGQLSESGAQQIAEVLLQNMDEATLVVISSDFTHYGRGFDYVPFDVEVEKNIKQLDLGAFELIKQKDLHGFREYIHRTAATICGKDPIAVLLAMMPESAEVKLLRYDNSGNMTGDWTHCVSYLSAAVTGTWTSRKDESRSALMEEPNLVLSESDKIGLLRLARCQILTKLGVAVPELAVFLTPPMGAVMGAFVTLHKHGRLRGCIGEIFPKRALHEAVSEHAINAAFHDPRFPPVGFEELDEIDIEISALSMPEVVESYRDIVIGQHGVVLSKGGRSAVFLPQVAPEQGWGIKETLSHLAQKAGLAPNDWKSGCSFQVFEATVFGEVAG